MSKGGGQGMRGRFLKIQKKVHWHWKPENRRIFERSIDGISNRYTLDLEFLTTILVSPCSGAY